MEVIKKDGSIVWFAHCHTCGKDIESAQNGDWVDCAARVHIKENTDHSVDVGYRYSEITTDDIDETNLREGEHFGMADWVLKLKRTGHERCIVCENLDVSFAGNKGMVATCTKGVGGLSFESEGNFTCEHCVPLDELVTRDRAKRQVAYTGPLQ